MANHGYVKTKKKMTSDLISQMLNNLNGSHFKGNLKIDFNKDDQSWYLVYESDDKEYGVRICWLKKEHEFEMRHGGGAHFVWWIDSVIRYEVAYCFDGLITDDADDTQDSPMPNRERYKSFSVYLDDMFVHQTNNNIKIWLKQSQMEFTPPEFQIDLGPKIEIDINVDV